MGPSVTVNGLSSAATAAAHAASALILVCADEGEDERTALARRSMPERRSPS